MTRALVSAVVLGTLSLAATAASQSIDVGRLERELRLELADDERLLCGTGLDELREGDSLRDEADGTPLFFFQDPPVINYDYRGEVTLRDVTVVGNVSKINFDPSISDANQSHPDETWIRTGTDTLDGVKVSLFARTFAAEEIDLFFAGKRTGFDQPDLFIGALEPDLRGRSGSVVTRFNINLRVAPTSMKKVSVKRLDSQVSYSSDVINIVLPGFGNDRAQDGFSIQDRELAQAFYDSFKDTAHVIAMIPRWTNLSSEFSAFHRRTKQTITGIGTTIRDRNDEYGNPKTLLGVEFFRGVRFGRASTWIHELTHQWGHHFDWDAIAGIDRAGHQPSAHLPLATGGDTLIGSVLQADREVTGTARLPRSARAFTIGFTEPPFVYHPWVKYSMGLLSRSKVPTLTVFKEQGQFDPDSATSPDVSTAVEGGTVQVSIDDITEALGERTGPKAPKKLKRAVVVVSREEVMSQAEFDYWTWVAQRHTYAKKDNGTMTFRGFGSLFQTSERKIKLVNVVDPKGGPKAKGRLKVAYPDYQRDDWRAVEFAARVPTKIKAGKAINFSGRVIATDRSDFNRMLIRLRKHDPAGTDRLAARAEGPALLRKADDIEIRDDLGSDSTFSGSYTFSAAERGRYSLEFFVFWPDSGSQFDRETRTVFHVE